MNFFINRFRLIGPEDQVPDVSFIPSMQRRKLSRLTRLALGVAEEVAPMGREFPLVYASRFGEWGQSLEQQLRYFREKEMSPAGFSSSVHNTAPGQHSILKKNHKTYTAIAAANQTFDAGMAESTAMLLKEEEAVYLCAGEEKPEVYQSAFNEKFPQFTIGLWIGQKKMEEAAIPLKIDFAARNVVSGDDFSRACDFIRFLNSNAPTFDGPYYTLYRCKN